MMGDSDDTDGIALYSVNQGIRKIMEGKRSGLAFTTLTHCRELSQQSERTFDLVDELVRCAKRAFADVPINGGIGIGLRFIANADLKHFLHRGLWCEAET